LEARTISPPANLMRQFDFAELNPYFTFCLISPHCQDSRKKFDLK
jgi:hypothetical protein